MDQRHPRGAGPGDRGEKYAVVLSANVKDVEAFAWAYTLEDPYAGGVPAMITTTDEDPGWGYQFDKDLGFRTYVDPGADGDEDSFGAYQECDDTNPGVNPDATETYNQLDDDCDGAVDEGFSAPARRASVGEQRHRRRGRQRHGALGRPPATVGCRSPATGSRPRSSTPTAWSSRA